MKNLATDLDPPVIFHDPGNNGGGVGEAGNVRESPRQSRGVTDDYYLFLFNSVFTASPSSCNR